MTYQPSEKKAVENPVVRFAQQNGVLVLKVNPMWSAGWPDRVFFVPGGRPLFIEFKRPGGKTSRKQEEVISKLRSAGYDVEVCEEVEQGKSLIRSRLGADGVHAAGDEVPAAKPRKRPVPRSRTAKD